jgi:hypothetical protein
VHDCNIWLGTPWGRDTYDETPCLKFLYMVKAKRIHKDDEGKLGMMFFHKGKNLNITTNMVPCMVSQGIRLLEPNLLKRFPMKNQIWLLILQVMSCGS